MGANDPATLAIDLGGTRIKAGIVADNVVLEHCTLPTGDEGGFDAVLGRMIAVGERLMTGRTISAVGISVPGIVDLARGEAVFL